MLSLPSAPPPPSGLGAGDGKPSARTRISISPATGQWPYLRNPAKPAALDYATGASRTLRAGQLAGAALWELEQQADLNYSGSNYFFPYFYYYYHLYLALLVLCSPPSPLLHAAPGVLQQRHGAVLVLACDHRGAPGVEAAAGRPALAAHEPQRQQRHRAVAVAQLHTHVLRRRGWEFGGKWGVGRLGRARQGGLVHGRRAGEQQGTQLHAYILK